MMWMKPLTGTQLDFESRSAKHHSIRIRDTMSQFHRMIKVPKPHSGLMKKQAKQEIEMIGYRDIETFETTNIEPLRSRGVTFHREPTEQSYGEETAFEDRYRNKIRL